MYLFCCPCCLRQKALCCFWWFEFPLLRCGSDGMVPSHHGSCFWKSGWWRSSFVWAVIFQGTFNLVQFPNMVFKPRNSFKCQNLVSLYTSMFHFSSPLIIYLFFLLSPNSQQLRPLSFMLHISFIHSFIFLWNISALEIIPFLLQYEYQFPSCLLFSQYVSLTQYFIGVTSVY